MLKSNERTSYNIGKYRIKAAGERVIISVLIGADQTLIGLKVKNSTIISMKFGELNTIVQDIYGPTENNRFLNSVLDHFRPPAVAGNVLNLNDCELIVLETICMNHSDIFALDSILKALKLYHGADIYSCYSINYRLQDGMIRHGGLGRTVQYEHAIGLIKPHYSLTETQKAEFPQWYASVFIKLIQPDRNDGYRAMLRLYDTSYLIGLCEPEFIMLFTILETLFGTDLAKITAHIAKGTSVLLGRSSKEKRSIRNQIYQLYDVRSRFVHDGKDVPQEALFELREIVRRVLVEICIRGYHIKEKSLNELRDILLPDFTQSLEEPVKEETMTE